MDRIDDIAYILPYLPYRTIYKTKKKIFLFLFSFPSPWFVFLPNRKQYLQRCTISKKNIFKVAVKKNNFNLSVLVLI